MKNEYGKSDSPIIPEKSPNKVQKRIAEVAEGRGLAKGNSPKRNMPWTQSRTSMPRALEWVRRVAKRDKRQRFTALLHHVYEIDQLRAAYYGVKRSAAPGIDGKTWDAYGKNLEDNLQDLSENRRTTEANWTSRAGRQNCAACCG